MVEDLAGGREEVIGRLGAVVVDVSINALGAVHSQAAVLGAGVGDLVAHILLRDGKEGGETVLVEFNINSAVGAGAQSIGGPVIFESQVGDLQHIGRAFQRGSLPEKNAEMAAQMQTVETALTASVQDAGADPWDHTLAYAYDDGVFHGYLYAVPDGMGIEFDKNSYLWDAENPIYSRYVMCGHDTRVAARLLAENWQQVVSTEDLVIYKRP